MRITHRLAGLVSALFLNSHAAALALEAKTQDVTRANASEFSLNIYVTKFQATCSGVQVWASVPPGKYSETVFGAAVLVRSEENMVDLNAPLPIVTYPPQPDVYYEYREPIWSDATRSWAEERRSEHGFRGPGFRGVSFCINEKMLPRASLVFESGAVIYRVAPLSEWNTSKP